MERGIPDGVEDESAAAAQISGSNESELTKWAPNETLFRSLVEMGFTEIAANKSLFYTGNTSQEAAIEWIFSNPDSSEIPLELEGFVGDILSDEDEDDDEDHYKMVFVVNTSLQMQTGKTAAQVAHAALGVHRLLLQNESKYRESLLSWSENGEKKIVLRVDSASKLVELETKAHEANLPCYLVHDAGRTQVAAGSTTVLGIFGPNNEVDSVTGSLRLL